MAEKNTLTVDDTFDFGIRDTASFGNIKAMEAVLSGTPIQEEAEAEEELEEIDPEKEAAKKKAEAKTKQLEAARKAAEEKRKAEAEKKSVEQLVFGEDEEDKEEKEEKEEDKDEKVEGSEDDKPEENDIEVFAKDLIRLGVLSQEDENEKVPKTGEELLEKFNKEKQAGAVQWINGFLERFGDDRKELFDAIFVQGVEPSEFLPKYVKLENLKGLDITKEDNQEMVFREFYRRIKIAPEKIESKLQKAKDNGDLESDAKEFLDQIILQDDEALETQKQKDAAKHQAKKRADDEYKGSLQKVLMEKVKARELNGIPVSQEIATKVFDFLHTEKYRAADGTLLTEFDKFIMDTKRPENIEKRIILALLQLSNFDFSKITKRAVSTQSNQLFNTFAQRQAKKTGAAAPKKGAVDGKDWLEL